MTIKPTFLLLSALALSACDSADPIGVNTPDATVAAGDTGSAAADATAQPGDDAAAPASDATPTPDDDAAQPADDAAVVVVPDAGFAPDAAAPDAEPMPLPRFSFFVTSIEAMRQLSGSNDGFGGNLSYDGATGLEGADRICAAAAELGQPGAGRKTWRAFLSASTGGANGGAVHAIERIGSGPWYDANQRLVASDLTGLAMTRPAGDAQITNDLPNERGESQRNQPGTNGQGTADNHDILTGSDTRGRYPGGAASTTCNDWTSAGANVGRPMAGHSWPAMSGQNWMRAHNVAGCEALVNLTQNGPGDRNCRGVGCGGGYGGLYCFALEP